MFLNLSVFNQQIFDQNLFNYKLRCLTSFNKILNLIGYFRLPINVSNHPLTYNTYNSLHDPHCREFLLQSRVFRQHLERQGFLTSDMRVVAAPGEQRQRVRAHELLERREVLVEKVSVIRDIPNLRNGTIRENLST